MIPSSYMECLLYKVEHEKRQSQTFVVAFMLTPGIHAGITFLVRASLAGICARPKAHPEHVLLPFSKGRDSYVSC